LRNKQRDGCIKASDSIFESKPQANGGADLRRFGKGKAIKGKSETRHADSLFELSLEPGPCCSPIRWDTERPATIEEGTNTLVGPTTAGILSAYKVFKNGGSKKGRVPQLWDGKAAERIVNILLGRPYEPVKPKVHSKGLSQSE
jgi:hypothetical protein